MISLFPTSPHFLNGWFLRSSFSLTPSLLITLNNTFITCCVWVSVCFDICAATDVSLCVMLTWGVLLHYSPSATIMSFWLTHTDTHLQHSWASQQKYQQVREIRPERSDLSVEGKKVCLKEGRKEEWIDCWCTWRKEGRKGRGRNPFRKEGWIQVFLYTGSNEREILLEWKN